MKIVLTLPEARYVLNKATTYLFYRSKSLVEKITMDATKVEMIRECLEDCEPGSAFLLENMLNLTDGEKDMTYNAINHLLQTQAIQIAFANEYDDEGAASPMMFLNVSLETLLTK